MSAAELTGAIAAASSALVAAIAAVVSRLDARRSSVSASSAQKIAEDQNKSSKRIADFAEDQAKNSERMVGFAHDTFKSSCRPIIVSAATPEEPFKYSRVGPDERNWWGRGDLAGYIRFPIRNVGVGPALIGKVILTSESHQEYGGFATLVAMTPGDTALLAYLAPVISVGKIGLIRALERGESITAEIAYSDIGAGQGYLTRFELLPRGNTHDFHVRGTKIFECDAAGNTRDLSIASNELPEGNELKA